MMAKAIIHEKLKISIWTKCAATATKPENIIVNPHNGKFTHEKFYGKMPYYKKHLKTVLEILVVRSIVTIKAKVED